jgi:FecR protein
MGRVYYDFYQDLSAGARSRWTRWGNLPTSSDLAADKMWNGAWICRRASRYKCGFAYFILIVMIAQALPAQAAEPSVGIITRVENEAEVISAGSPRVAQIGTVVHLKDELRTGENARLQLTFRDNTTLVLGEGASVTIDRYIFDPDLSSGVAAIEASRGAIRFATGKLQNMRQKTIAVTTPVATIGVRGTEFWAGPLDPFYGVLLLSPAVDVSNQGGSVALTAKGQGTDIQSPLTTPSQPVFWTAAKVALALGMTNFGVSPGQMPDQNQDRPKRQRDGQQQQRQQQVPDQKYALTPSLPLFLSAIPLGAFIATTSQDGDRPASP